MMYVSANEKAVSLNLHRYTEEHYSTSIAGAVAAKDAKLTAVLYANRAVGRCTLHHVDP